MVLLVLPVHKPPTVGSEARVPGTPAGTLMEPGSIVPPVPEALPPAVWPWKTVGHDVISHNTAELGIERGPLCPQKAPIVQLLLCFSCLFVCFQSL